MLRCPEENGGHAGKTVPAFKSTVIGSNLLGSKP
jgi:hypothetical protein